MPKTIYLDNNATTQPLGEVVEAVTECLREGYANPSSVHQCGQSARHRVETARMQVADLIGASAREILFTSGGTESINLAIRGVLSSRGNRRHIVTTAVEHSAVLRNAERLEREGYVVDYIGVDGDGRLNGDEFQEKVTPETALVSIQFANNETGVLFDVGQWAAIAAEQGVPVHVDAVQAVGKVPIDVSQLPVSVLSLSAHKFHGPKGVGALYVRKRTHLEPQIVGGRQERDLRGGTENVPGIVGMGVAAEAAKRAMRELEPERIAALRDLFEQDVLRAVPFASVNGADAPRIGNTANISFEGLEAEAILILLSEAGVCASAGSACSSGSLEPSHVLMAMGLEERFTHGAVRFSLSRFTTEQELREVVELLPRVLGKLRALTPT